MQVYVNKDGQQSGPFTVEQLRQFVQQGNFTTGDYACHDGQNWVTIAQIPGFAEATQPAATPSPTAPRQDRAVQEKGDEQQPVSAGGSSRASIWTGIVGFAMLLLAGLWVWLLDGLGGLQDAQEKEAETETSPEANQSPAAAPDPKTAQVGVIDLDDPETRNKVGAEAIDENNLQRRGKKGEKLLYAPNQQTPYTGWVKNMRSKPHRIGSLYQCKDGKQHGLRVAWYANGQKRRERTYKDGELMTIVDWTPGGEKFPEPKLVIITRTGNGKNANSDGHSPHAHIIGLDGSSSYLGRLDNIEVDDREAGSIDIFSLPLDSPVSDIQGVEIVAKGNDAWRAETISFQFFDDGKKSKPYAFEVNQWFSAEKKDLNSIGAIKSKKFSFRPHSEANQSPASSPDAKIAQVGKIDLDDPETRKKITARAINWRKLQWRGRNGEKLLFAPNQKKPYTGWGKAFHDNGQIRNLAQYKDGKKSGFARWWYGNEQKGSETTWKNGKVMTVAGWKPNGDKCPETNVLNGNGVHVLYKQDGTEGDRRIYREGELVSD